MSITINEFLNIHSEEITVDKEILKENKRLEDMGTKGGGNFNSKNDYNALAIKLASACQSEFEESGKFPTRITLSELTVWKLLRPEDCTWNKETKRVEIEGCEESVVNNLGHALVKRVKKVVVKRQISFLEKVNHQQREDGEGYMYRFYIIQPSTDSKIDLTIKKTEEIVSKVLETKEIAVTKEVETDEEKDSKEMVDYLCEGNKKLKKVVKVLRGVGRSWFEIEEKLLKEIKV